MTSPDDGPRLDGTTQRVTLHLDGIGRASRVQVAGVDISNAVRSLDLSAGAGYIPRLTLDLGVVDGVEFAGEARVSITSATRDLLIRGGWTPPPDAG